MRRQLDDINTRVAAQIRSRRMAVGLSQEGLADACGLHRTYIGAVERGERNITLNTLQKIAKALKCEPAELIARPSDG
jgi:transcriptional regulator with XRE-family HTH domain